MIRKRKWVPFSLLRYPGGKYYALKNILKLISDIDHDEYREPFFGGGTVFFNKKPAKTNIINDKYQDLIFFLKFIKIKKNVDDLTKLFEKTETPSKDNHYNIKIDIPNTPLEKAYKL